ncbi:hypothetical protein ABC955_10355 [Citromicrobium bathyomarinum]
MTLEQEINSLAKHDGAIGRMLAILIGSLHQAGVINGRSIAASIRLDTQSDEAFRMATADAILAVIEKAESDGISGLRPVED